MNILKKYDLELEFVARNLTLETFAIIAKDNIDLNAIYFSGTGMTTMEFPWKENQVVKQNVICDLSLLDNSKK